MGTLRAVTVAPDDTADLLTIEELAGRTGISVRTIRFYAGKGLLPPPTLRGRLGLYGPDHLARLDLISELTGLGFTLSAIEGFLSSLPERVGVEGLVLQRALLVPWVPEPREKLDADELTRRVGRPLKEDEVDSLEALGVLERQEDGGYVLHGAAALTSAVEYLDAGASPDHLRRTQELIDKHMNALAEDLMESFQQDILQPYRDRGRPVSERVRLGQMFTRLKPITIQGVMTAFGRAVNRTIRERYES